MQSTRKLQITRRWRKVRYGPGTMVPEIRLVGKWLAKEGFQTGAIVKVEIESRQIIIRLA